MLEVKNVSAYYGDAQALEDVSLSLPAHGVTAFLGPNAAGKSTTLRVVSGLIPAATGTIEFEGRDITRTSPQERVAMGIVHVPEGRRLFNTMTVEDNLIWAATRSARTARPPNGSMRSTTTSQSWPRGANRRPA
jgi:branched-chain amino acid transport system ATP-binding protein